MFLAEYDYNEDIAVKKEEAYEDGFNDGFDDGAEKNKMENARALIAGLNLKLGDIAKYLNLSSEQQEILEKELSEK